MTRPTIVFQGREGAYSQAAAWHLFGTNITTRACDTFEQVFQAVENGEAQGGVVPIENSTAGSIHENYDNLLRWRLPIVAEIKLRVEHVLMACKGSSVEQLREVRSHPQALAQCSRFFADNPQVRRVAAFDTAGSAEEIAAAQDLSLGAIASAFAAERNGLSILRRNLENIPGTNFTRFFGVSKQSLQTDPGIHTKTSIAFALENRPGSLYHAMGYFAHEGVDLTRIESRPREGSPWEYVFYVDFLGHPKQENVERALKHLAIDAHFWHDLGSYRPGPEKTLDETPWPKESAL